LIGTQIAVNGLVEILAELHFAGRQANKETAEEIIEKVGSPEELISLRRTLPAESTDTSF